MKKVILLLVFFLFACNKETKQNKQSKKQEKHELKNILEEENLQPQEYIPYKDDKFDFNDKNLYVNLRKAINDGDTRAYDLVAKQYIINGRQKEFLYYAIIMAEKNNYTRAYSDISTILGIYNYENASDMKFISKYGDYSLLKAYELGDEGAQQSVNRIYIEKGKQIPKSTSIYCK